MAQIKQLMPVLPQNRQRCAKLRGKRRCVRNGISLEQLSQEGKNKRQSN